MLNPKQCLKIRPDQVQLSFQRPDSQRSCVVYKIQYGLRNESYCGEQVRHLIVRVGEHIGTSPLTKKHVKPQNSSVAYYVLIYNHSASYGDFSILTRENKNFILAVKENLLVMRNKPSLNRNITSAPLYLLDKPQ